MSVNSVSQHYLGQQGEQYIRDRLDRDVDHLGYLLNFEYFKPHLNPGDCVLDFGAGTGGMMHHLKGAVARVEGLEVNPAAAQLARARTGCPVYLTLDEIPADRRYDAIVSNHVLEHVRNVCDTLDRLRLLLRPGGLFITKLPIDDPHASRQRRWDKADVDHHLQTWSPRIFANCLFETGFEVVDIRVVTSAWHPRIFPFRRLGLDKLAFWALAVVKRRRQLLAIARRPASEVGGLEVVVKHNTTNAPASR